MLIFRQSGRLGNQIFQYSALRALCQDNEELILLGFEDLQSVFNNINAKIINSKSSKLEQSLYYRIYNCMDSLSQKNIITRIHESRASSKEPELIYNSALFEGVKFIAESFFQYQSSFDKEVILNLSINEKLLVIAKEFLNISHSNTPIFVHIRRGDYLKWPNCHEPAVLSATYYRICIDIIQSKISNPFFVFTSDDPFYVKDTFGDLKNSFVSSFSSFEDFVIMTQCQGGILSASSFSWWAAYFSQLQHTDSTFLAPKYWAGHRSESWYPPFIESGFLKYVNV